MYFCISLYILRAALFPSGSHRTNACAFKHMGHRFHINCTEHAHSKSAVHGK